MICQNNASDVQISP